MQPIVHPAWYRASPGPPPTRRGAPGRCWRSRARAPPADAHNRSPQSRRQFLIGHRAKQRQFRLRPGRVLVVKLRDATVRALPADRVDCPTQPRRRIPRPAWCPGGPGPPRTRGVVADADLWDAASCPLHPDRHDRPAEDVCQLRVGHRAEQGDLVGLPPQLFPAKVGERARCAGSLHGAASGLGGLWPATYDRRNLPNPRGPSVTHALCLVAERYRSAVGAAGR